LSLILVVSYLFAAAGLEAGESVSTQRSDYLGIVKAYADAMIEHGRDTYGKERSPLFAAALDRRTMKIGSFGNIPGVRNGDRSLGGANPQEDTGLYAILYKLTELTGEKKYAEEADKALKFFFTHCQSPNTGLMAWGEHLYWDFNQERRGGKDACHEICGEWQFWDQCYRLAPEECWRFAIGQWKHQVADEKTGDFSRHARWSRHGPGRGADFPRYAGQMIANWADTYARKENEDRKERPELVTAISVIVARMESNMKKSQTGYLLAGTDRTHRTISWPGSNLELARCLWKSAFHMDSELATRMKKLALQQDVHFLSLPHTISSGGGFVSCVDSTTGKPRSRLMNKPYTSTWSTGYGYGTHAGTANRCVSRFRQIGRGHPELAAKYLELIVAAAGLYLTSEPDSKSLLKPGSFDTVIAFMLNSHEITGEKEYIERADHFAQLGATLFLNDGLPLPKTTNRHEHYETITGGPGFMYVLLKLHERMD
jgi:hypothetical protein